MKVIDRENFNWLVTTMVCIVPSSIVAFHVVAGVEIICALLCSWQSWAVGAAELFLQSTE